MPSVQWSSKVSSHKRAEITGFEPSVYCDHQRYLVPLDMAAALEMHVKGYANNYQIGSFGDAKSQMREVLLQSNVHSLENQRWLTYISDPDAPNDVDAISETVSHVLGALERAGADAVNLEVLEKMPINSEHLVAVLRTTFPCRQSIHGWGTALELAKVALTRDGHNPAEVLTGLS